MKKILALILCFAAVINTGAAYKRAEASTGVAELLQYDDFIYSETPDIYKDCISFTGVPTDEAHGFQTRWQRLTNVSSGDTGIYANTSGWLYHNKYSTDKVYRTVYPQKAITTNPSVPTVYLVSWEQYIPEGVIMEASHGSCIGLLIDGTNIKPRFGITTKDEKTVVYAVSKAHTPAQKYGSNELTAGTYKFVLEIHANPEGTNDVIRLKAYPQGGTASEAWDIAYEVDCSYTQGVLGIHSQLNSSGTKNIQFYNYRAEKLDAEAYSACESKIQEVYSSDVAELGTAVSEAKAEISEFSGYSAGSFLSDRLAAAIEYRNYDEANEISVLLQRRQQSIVGTSENASNEKIMSVITDLSDTASSYADSMLQDGSVLWQGDNYAYGTTTGVGVYAAYQKLHTMVKAYYTVGSALYKDTELWDKILYAIRLLNQNAYNTGVNYTAGGKTNWWYYEIGIPNYIGDILILTEGELPISDKSNLVAAIGHFSPNPQKGGIGGNSNMTATNLIWKCSNAIDIGIATRDVELINTALSLINSEMQYAEEAGGSDGFYRDGSFIQHGSVAYNGGYGVDAFLDVSDIISLMQGTQFAVNMSEANNVYYWAKESFAPLMYNCAMLDMVRGRYISRYSLSSRSTALQVLRAMLSLAESSDEENKQMLYEIILDNITTTENENAFISGLSINLISAAEALFGKEHTPTAKEEARVFYNMDRAVYRTDNFLFGIAMSSDRVSAYETANDENLRGWYTGLGTTALQKSDYFKYSRNYWNTVNPQELSGLTMVERNMKNKHFTATKYQESYAGGAVLDGKAAAVGFKLRDYTDEKGTLKANKAWFMMDGYIAALGNSINVGKGISDEERAVKTIVETRAIDAAAGVYMNNRKYSLGQNMNTAVISSAYITDSQIGYYFPNEQAISLKTETRQGSWQDINAAESADIQTNNYATISIEHGTNPEAASYSYVILPNCNSRSVLADYVAAPTMTILQNDQWASAVRSEKSGTVGVCFWKRGRTEEVTSDTALSVVYKKTDTGLSLSVADPEHKSGTAEIVFNEAVSNVISCNTAIEVIETAPQLKLKVKLDGLGGKSVSAVLER